MQRLDEDDFVRSKLLDGDVPAWKRYASMTVGEASLWTLIRYELITMLLGPIPGALGLVLRKAIYPGLFRSCGRKVIFGRNLTIRHGNNIDISDNVVIDDNVVLDGRGATGAGLRIGANCILGRGVLIHAKVGDIEIGENCNFGTHTVVVSTGGVEISDWVQIAGGCKISGGKFKGDPSRQSGRPYVRYTDGPIRIGESCFIGGSVDVTDGVQIGRGSVIGTGAVVMSNIPEFSVYMPRPGMLMGRTIADDSQDDSSDGTAAA